MGEYEQLCAEIAAAGFPEAAAHYQERLESGDSDVLFDIFNSHEALLELLEASNSEPWWKRG